MNSLPVELLRQIFGECDSTSVKSLRLVSPRLADVGSEYLLRADFYALPYRDDYVRLRSISRHPQLRHAIQTVHFNFTEIDYESVRHSAFVATPELTGEERMTVMDDVTKKFSRMEKRRRGRSALFHYNADKMAKVFRQLSNLEEVNITFARCPYDIPVIETIMEKVKCWGLDSRTAAHALNTLIDSLKQAMTLVHEGPLWPPPGPLPAPSTRPRRLSPEWDDLSSECNRHDVIRAMRDVDDRQSSAQPPLTPPAEPPCPSRFTVEGFPLEIFRHQADRRLWFQSTDVVFANLTHLNLVFDWTHVVMPSAKFRAVNGLGYVLRKAPLLTHLSLGFDRFGTNMERFVLLFHELFCEDSLSHHEPHHDEHEDASSLHGQHGHGVFGPGPVSHVNHINHVSSHAHGIYSHGGHPPNHFLGGSSSAANPGGGFTFTRLTEFKLQGVACEAQDLLAFLLRHADTLEGLRLGGWGLTPPMYGPQMGGFRLFNGNFRQLFTSLRGGKLPHLQRLHLEGELDCGIETLRGPDDLMNLNGHHHGPHHGPPHPGLQQHQQAQANGQADGVDEGDPPDLSRPRFERYLFHAITDDDWQPATGLRAQPTHMEGMSMDSHLFEKYVLGTLDAYPGNTT